MAAGWMIDDGTCTPCLRGNCYRCADPVTEYDDDGAELVCCCEEAVHLVHLDEEEPAGARAG